MLTLLPVPGEPVFLSTLPQGSKIQLTVLTSNGAVNISHSKSDLLQRIGSITGGIPIAAADKTVELYWEGDLWVMSGITANIANTVFDLQTVSLPKSQQANNVASSNSGGSGGATYVHGVNGSHAIQTIQK